MKKRRPSFDASQLSLNIGSPAVELRDGALIGIERRVASAVALALRDDPRCRIELAADVSSLLGETVSRAMLDGYASEARVTHNISFARALALIAATRRYDILNALLGEIGARIITAEELLTLKLGDARVKLGRLRRDVAFLEAVAPEIGGMS